MIKIEHTLFALPFTLSAAVLAIDYLNNQNALLLAANPEATITKFNPIVFLWIVLCMLGARSAGMTLNRIIDAEVDAANPRTADREIPKGKISKAQAWLFTFISFSFLIYATFQLPKLCQYLLPIPVIWVWVYPYLKRFTWFCHFFLGTTLAGAALGGWIAITGTLDTLAPVFFSFAVLSWVAGFDIIYACQDYEHDIKAGIKSVPARFGLKGALQISRFLHFLSPVFLYFTAEALNLGLVFKIGVLLTIAALFYEQKLVKAALKENNMQKIDKAFFEVNSWISVLILFFVILEITLS